MTIDINELTYGQIQEIARLAHGTKRKAKAHPFTGRRVLVRSYGAGVFYGTLASKTGNEVMLTDCRRIWNWKGANTCSEIALSGIAPSGSKVAMPTPEHVVLDVIEVIPVADSAAKILDAAGWS